MDMITSNCDNAEYSSFQPLLPSDADTRDVVAAIEVIEQGGMHFDDHDDNNSDGGLKGIGIKILGGTTVLGSSREINSLELHNSDDDSQGVTLNSRILMQETAVDSPLVEKLSSAAVTGLWDDSQREHVAVPFVCYLAIALDLNRPRIQELDSDGHTVTTSLRVRLIELTFGPTSTSSPKPSSSSASPSRRRESRAAVPHRSRQNPKIRVVREGFGKNLILAADRSISALRRPAAIPAVVAGQAFRVKRRRDEEQRLKAARGREKSSDEVFVCERVCTSKRMLKKVGAFSKDPIPETCVTVCGVSELDACADACARTVCVNQHQVPNWNDVCLKRCQSECLKLSSTLM
ncbi:hypothetical protein GUJ93_ZPchr0013g37236 [Zizania palustris]|uniref:Uncharacterized protein n=1 Tax=Zizania palustris TaxID=103762 RepID=A0A8J5X0K5_ZIZPA|nr:hypothetical protein GUJ93_ZPchr0013g37236 [Zizania palustris]